jgi:thiamine biosynthesis lipoprotein
MADHIIDNLALRTVTTTGHALGTKITLTVFGTTDRTFTDGALKLIKSYEDLLTVNREPSLLMTVNHQAGRQPVQVTPMVFELVKAAVAASREQFGFNALIGPLVKLWKIGFKDARVPTVDEIHQRLRLIDPFQVELDAKQQTFFLKQPGMEIDLGGIAKGYIADRVRDYWRSFGITNGMINLGGNLLFVGPSPRRHDGQWVIGVQDPRKQRGADCQQVLMPECSAVTSGTYERQLVRNGHHYHHLLDSQTGMPRKTNVASVTIFSKHSITGEVEAKRLFFAGRPLPGWGVGRPDLYGALFIYNDGRTEFVDRRP